jgi:hypothetical protein
MLQQGQVDAVSTDDVVLRGLEHQDPNVEVVGDSVSDKPYGVGVKLLATTWFDSSGSSNVFSRDGTWGGSTTPIARLWPIIAARGGCRTDHDRADHDEIDANLRPRKEVASMANMVGWTTTPGSCACVVIADWRDRTAVDGGQSLAQLWDDGVDDVIQESRADGAGAPIETRRRQRAS